MSDLKGALTAIIQQASQAAAAELKAKNPDISNKAVKADGTLDWAHIDTGIEYGGKKIMLPDEPDRMPIDNAVQALLAKKKDLETVLDAYEIIDAHPLDGIVAFARALKQIYGWANSVPTPGFFGPTPPKMLTISVGPKDEDKIQVPWGGFSLPGVDSPIHTTATRSDRGACLVLYGKVKKKDFQRIKEIADLTRLIVKEHSIYRGKAIRLRSVSEEGVDMNNPPEFIDVHGASPEDLVLPRSVEAQINTNIWTLVEKTTQCREAKIPLKRGVLLEGKYGVGKTLTSLLTAQKCVANGWTFISLDRSQGLAQTLEFARRYEPCVIFAEDIDRAANERDESTNDLLNIMDGVLSKNSQIMVVMTTNHIERINQAMLRPGRLDAVVSLLPPDAEAVERLLRIYGRNLIKKTEKLNKISQTLAGNIPAMIREVVERSKLAAISLGDTNITQEGLLIAAEGMKQHMALLAGPPAKATTVEEDLGLALGEVVKREVAKIVARSTSMVMETLDHSEDMSAGDILSNKEAGRFELSRISNVVLPPKNPDAVDMSENSDEEETA